MRTALSRLRPIHLLRYGLPGGMAIAGIVLMALGGTHHTTESAIGLTALCIAIFIWLTNVFARMSIVSQNDRQREALAREQYSRTRTWADPQTLAASGPAPTPPPRPAPPEAAARPSADSRPEPEHTATPSPAPQRPSRPYSAPARIRSRGRGGAGGSGHGRRPG